MQSYKLFVLDTAGRVVDSHPFQSPDDESACGWANHVASERRFELWHEKRRVHCSHKGPSVLDTYFEIGGIQHGPIPVWFAAGAIHA